MGFGSFSRSLADFPHCLLPGWVSLPHLFKIGHNGGLDSFLIDGGLVTSHGSHWLLWGPGVGAQDVRALPSQALEQSWVWGSIVRLG